MDILVICTLSILRRGMVTPVTAPCQKAPNSGYIFNNEDRHTIPARSLETVIKYKAPCTLAKDYVLAAYLEECPHLP